MAAPYNPPKKNEDFLIRISLEDMANSGSFKSSPTIAAGDFKVDKDAGGLTNLATLPSVSPASSVLVLITLSSTEMNADVVTLVGIDQTSPKEWADFVLCIQTTQDSDQVVTVGAMAANVVTAASLAADVTTELRALVTGTSDAGGSTSTMLDAARTEADDVWNGAWILFTSGAVANQVRLITDFVAATDTLSFTPDATASIGAGITYEILPAAGAFDLGDPAATRILGRDVSDLIQGDELSLTSLIVSMGYESVSVNDGSPTASDFDTFLVEATNNHYNGHLLRFIQGPLAGQARIISTYTGGSKNCAFNQPFTEAPGDGDGFVILPPAGPLFEMLLQQATGEVDANTVLIEGGDATAAINTEVLDVLNVDTFAEPGQEAPPATTTLVKKIGYLYKFLRNKITQTSTTLSVFADDAATVDQKATVSDDATTYTRGEIGTGP